MLSPKPVKIPRVVSRFQKKIPMFSSIFLCILNNLEFSAEIYGGVQTNLLLSSSCFPQGFCGLEHWSANKTANLPFPAKPKQKCFLQVVCKWRYQETKSGICGKKSSTRKGSMTKTELADAQRDFMKHHAAGTSLSRDQFAYRIPNPKHTHKYTKVKVPHTQDKHTQLSNKPISTRVFMVLGYS